MRAHTAAAATLLLTLPALALAADPDPNGERPVDPRLASTIPLDLAQRAGITPGQREEISRLTAQSNAELIDLRQKVRSAQQALERLLQAEQPPEDVVMAQIERMGAAETAVRKNRVALMLQIRHVLGPEAWANLQRELDWDRRLAQPQPREDAREPRVGEPLQVQTVSGTLRSAPR